MGDGNRNNRNELGDRNPLPLRPEVLQEALPGPTNQAQANHWRQALLSVINRERPTQEEVERWNNQQRTGVEGQIRRVGGRNSQLAVGNDGRLYVALQNQFVPVNVNAANPSNVNNEIVGAAHDVLNNDRSLSAPNRRLLLNIIENIGGRNSGDGPAPAFGAGFLGLSNGADANLDLVAGPQVREGSSAHLRWTIQQIQLRALQQLSGMSQTEFNSLLAGEISNTGLSALVERLGGRREQTPLVPINQGQDRQPTTTVPRAVEQNNNTNQNLNRPVNDLINLWANNGDRGTSGPTRTDRYDPRVMDMIDRAIEQNGRTWSQAEVRAATDLQQKYRAWSQGQTPDAVLIQLHTALNHGYEQAHNPNNQIFLSDRQGQPGSDGQLAERPLTAEERRMMTRFATEQSNHANANVRRFANELTRLMGEQGGNPTMTAINSPNAEIRRQAVRDALFVYQRLYEHVNNGTNPMERPPISVEHTSWSANMQSTADGTARPRVGNTQIPLAAWQQLIPDTRADALPAVPAQQPLVPLEEEAGGNRVPRRAAARPGSEALGFQDGVAFSGDPSAPMSFEQLRERLNRELAKPDISADEKLLYERIKQELASATPERRQRAMVLLAQAFSGSENLGPEAGRILADVVEEQARRANRPEDAREARELAAALRSNQPEQRRGGWAVFRSLNGNGLRALATGVGALVLVVAGLGAIRYQERLNSIQRRVGPSTISGSGT